MTDHDHHSDVLSELNPQHRALRQMIPEVYDGFGALSRAAMGSGAVRAGATQQEAAEVIGISIMMHGGPATIYGARAYTAFCEFADGAAPSA